MKILEEVPSKNPVLAVLPELDFAEISSLQL
jgi:hypothetical protein